MAYTYWKQKINEKVYLNLSNKKISVIKELVQKN